LRRALGLTQEEFAGRDHIPIGTLRDWEQGRSEPDQPARAYLSVVARDPDGVRRALEAKPGLTESKPPVLSAWLRAGCAAFSIGRAAAAC
jgi:transcriptional regulator with XRE-family HTH domain